MNQFIFSCMIFLVIYLPLAVHAQDKCFECHQTVDDNPSKLFNKDIHHEKGISCAGCHGGNSTTDDMDQGMDKKAGFLGVPKGDDISKRCAACHASPEKMKSYGSSLPTNQWDNLQESIHAMPSLKGKEHIVQCTNCHNAHGIVSVKNPASPVYPLNVVNTCIRCHANIKLMRSYNPLLPVDQLEKYRTSVHGIRNAKGDSKTAECASCHGSHNIRAVKDVKSKVYVANLPETCASCHSNVSYMKEYKIPTDQYEKYSRSVHGIALMQKHDAGAPACNNCHGNHGAVPPGVESISQVCGTCHALNAELFASSPHKQAYAERGLPECTTCHSNHEIVAATDKLLGVSSDAVCSRCHSETQNRNGYIAAKSMRALIDSLDLKEQEAKNSVDEAEQKGMDISEAKFKLRDVRQARLQSRTMVHAFNEKKFSDAAEIGIKTAVLIDQDSKNAIHEYYFRRIGLAISTIILTILAGSIYFYVKRLERKQSQRY